MKKWPKVSIIILNWNGWQDTIECLESLQNITYPNYQIIVVDNHSTNDSVKKIKEWASSKIEVKSNYFTTSTHKSINIREFHRNELEEIDINSIERKLNKISTSQRLVLIKNENNFGFSKGCNVGIKYALNRNYDYILLVNNDMVVDSNFLEPAVYLAEQDKNIGIIGGKIYYYNDNKRIWSACGYINWIKGSGIHAGNSQIDKGQFNRIRRVKLVSGALMLIKKKVLLDIGLLPEDYFFGVEEWDFSVKVSRKGLKLYYVPDFIGYHKVGKAHKTFNPKFIYNTYRNKLHFQMKYLPSFLWHIWDLVFYCYLNVYLRIRLSHILSSRYKWLEASMSNYTPNLNHVIEATRLARKDVKSGKPISNEILKRIEKYFFSHEN